MDNSRLIFLHQPHRTCDPKNEMRYSYNFDKTALQNAVLKMVQNRTASHRKHP